MSGVTVHNRKVAPPSGYEVDMMGVERRLLQSMTEGGVRAGVQMEASNVIILV